MRPRRRQFAAEAGSAEEIAAPAIVRPDHVRDRALSANAGAQKAWRRLSPLEAAFERGQLGGGSPLYDAQRRLQAGVDYVRLFALAQSSGRDSTDLDRIDGAAAGDGFSETQARAAHALGEIDRRMNARDRQIVRMVCAEGHFPSEAVRIACNDYRHTVPSRFREALDSLIEAMEAARRRRPNTSKAPA
jgi:hypothetical protein